MLPGAFPQKRTQTVAFAVSHNSFNALFLDVPQQADRRGDVNSVFFTRGTSAGSTPAHTCGSCVNERSKGKPRFAQAEARG